MPVVNFSCPHCSQALQIDPDRLPEQPVSSTCTSCKGSLTLDKHELLAREGAQTAPAVTTPAADAAAPPAATTTPASSASSTASEPPASTVPAEGAATGTRRLGKLPADATFPSGIILGEDETLIEEIRGTMAGLGSEIDRVESANDARALILDEQPELCIYVAGTVTVPPYAPMAALTGLPPNFRRRLYLVLVAENLKTLDGSAAFLYQVNMIVCRSDLSHLGAALHSGIDYHHRLYKHYVQAAERVGAL